ncbi:MULTISPECIES: hypothetical protein [unclassified Thermus]|jgi:hypothetical protein|uniref:hypothetical protein n=1 Tax=unclassified Thermus TaxID=2619321 RepID=UPI0025DB6887|nr:hypothetical protein [Thermus sp.]MCS6868637.1 hypothetical protein [Thermus sp.]MCX7850210.1 hypothetical protein [Thermus sp.]MDW8017224.1 hypothetical protein [Thermus sp.]MDW8357608.1 hypothetical protein [Thermus sp.]
MNLERLGSLAGKGVGVLGLLVLLLSLIRLDGAGVGLGVMLTLYGLGLLLLSGVYGELKAVREALGKRWDG